MKNSLLMILFVALSASANFVFAQVQNPPVWVEGRIDTLYVDPEDVVFILTDTNIPSPCKTNEGTPTNNFILSRSNTNFKEMYSLLLAAKMGEKTVSIQVIECFLDRGLISHGAML